MRITQREKSGVVVLDLQGKLELGEGDVKLRDKLLELLGAGKRKLLFNFAECKNVDSSGLGELIRCKMTAARESAQIKLVHLNLKIYKLLTMSQLVGVFEMFDDEEKAVASFE